MARAAMMEFQHQNRFRAHQITAFPTILPSLRRLPAADKTSNDLR
jgi:hypothetical protein